MVTENGNQQFSNPPQSSPLEISQTKNKGMSKKHVAIAIGICLVVILSIGGIVFADTIQKVLFQSNFAKPASNSPQSSLNGSSKQEVEILTTPTLPQPTTSDNQANLAIATSPTLTQTESEDILILTSPNQLKRKSSLSSNAEAFSTKLNSMISTTETIYKVISSPDYTQVLIESSRKLPDHENVVNLNGGERYFLVSNDGLQVEEINTIDLVTPFRDSKDWYGNVTFYGWSTNPNILIGVINMQGIVDMATKRKVYYAKGIIFEYSIKTKIAKGILTFKRENDGPSIPEIYAKLKFYDPDKGILAYALPSETRYQSKLHIKNLRTGSVSTYDLLTIENHDQYLQQIPLTSSNPLFVSVNKHPDNGDGRLTYRDRKKLSIYSYYNPTRPSATITLDEPRYDYGEIAVWSPDGKYFAVKVINSDNPLNAPGEPPKVKIYTKDGKLVSTTLFERGINGAMLWGGGFSTDNSRFIATSFVTYTDIKWDIIETETGNILSRQTYSGMPIFWRK